MSSLSLGPGRFTYDYADNEGTPCTLEGELSELAMFMYDGRDDEVRPEARGVRSHDIHCVANFTQDRHGSAFTLTRRVKENSKSPGRECLLTVEIPDQTLASVASALSEIKAPEDATISVGESDGKNYVVATWTL